MKQAKATLSNDVQLNLDFVSSMFSIIQTPDHVMLKLERKPWNRPKIWRPYVLL